MLAHLPDGAEKRASDGCGFLRGLKAPVSTEVLMKEKNGEYVNSIFNRYYPDEWIAFGVAFVCTVSLVILILRHV